MPVYSPKPFSRPAENKRALIVMIFFIFFAAILTIRLFVLQIIRHNYYLTLAEDQHEIFKKLNPERGTIYAHNDNDDSTALYPLATNREVYLVYAVPNKITKPDETLKQMEQILPFNWLADLNSTDATKKSWANDERAKLLARLSKADDPYEPVLRRVEDENIKKLETLNLKGIKWAPEKARFYPENTLAAQVLGFVSMGAQQEEGSYGLESHYNKTLSGEPGFLRAELGNLGNLITLGGQDIIPAENGADLVLTLDKNIAFFSCKALEEATKEFDADSGSLVIMEPQTGKILTMCNTPTYNPNKYNEVEDAGLFTNKAISIAYEPGSIFKPITMAAAIEEKGIDPFTTFQDPGQLKIADFTIYNYDKKSHGLRTMTQVLEESLNTGTVFAARSIGVEKFTKYVKAFGMGVKTGIDLYGEATGDISSLNKKHELYMATASFGQGIMTTPLQMATAYSAIINGGKLMKPYIVEEIRRPNKPVEKVQPTIVRQIISEETAKKVMAMLVSVVENGHAKRAKISGYMVGAKTGTAQIADPGTGKYSDKVTHSFAAFAPSDNPRFAIVMKLENVKKAQYAETSCTPTTVKIMKFILDYYAVEPEVK